MCPTADTRPTAEATTGHPSEVTTGRYRTPHGRFLAAMLWRHGMIWFSATAAIVVALAVLGAVLDLRFVILALMVLFFVLPVIAMFLYFNHGLRPEAFVCVMPHTVTFMPARKVRIDIFIVDKQEEDEDSCNLGAGTETADSGQQSEPAERTVSYYFTLRADRPYDVRREGITLLTEGKARGFVPVPYSAFISKEELQRAVELAAG